MAKSRLKTQVQRFHDLMPHRIREVLLVSSPYDAFILEEDGRLSEQILFEFKEVNLSHSPRFTMVPTGSAAIKLLKQRRYDLILTMTSLTDIGINALGRKVKALRPGRPVVLLALDPNELSDIGSRLDPKAIDRTFLWSGDPQILLAIIKYIEDRENVDHDIAHGDVRVILILEDSPRYYSTFLGLLYKALMIQSRSLYSQGVNEEHRRLYMRSRPKILHATTYEEGSQLLRRYRRNVMAVISDVGVPRKGKIDPLAGIAFVRKARKNHPELPVLLQSSEPRHEDYAKRAGVIFVNKSSKRLLGQIENFLAENLGFGDFIFRRDDGLEIDRARDLREFEEKIALVPRESLRFHAHHHHFSIWLLARSEFELAERLRPRSVSEFPDLEAVRRFLLELLRDNRKRALRGVISEFRRTNFRHYTFSRIGRGALGGKGRAIAFLARCLTPTSPSDFGGLSVVIPKTVVVTTEHFDEFMANNRLRDFAYSCTDDREIRRRFIDARLSDRLESDLEFICNRLEGPLSVRSSSLLEDSVHQPFAGVYDTVMIANDGNDSNRKLRELTTAIKLVYASTFYGTAKTYQDITGNRVEEEKMAVIIQNVVGQRHGDRFYPTFSGVAQTYNFYPTGPQQPEDGVVHVALGLGAEVVEGGLAVSFSPKRPQSTSLEPISKQTLDNSQRTFCALDLTSSAEDRNVADLSRLRSYDLAAAEEDKTLPWVGSVYDFQDGALRDDLRLSGPRVVSFDSILKHRALPLAKAMSTVLEMCSYGLGGSAEIEFACDMGALTEGLVCAVPELHLLQVRPFAATRDRGQKIVTSTSREHIVCASNRSLGHGLIDSVHDVIFVHPKSWKPEINHKIAAEIGRLNRNLSRQDRPYMLIGPGRWGSSDPSLGIPVSWKDISRVRVIVEVSPRARPVEPSQGSHFFQNITSLRIGYLTLPSHSDKAEVDSASEQFLDWQWLLEQEPHRQTRHLRLLRFEQPLSVILDGVERRGIIVRPSSPTG